MHESCRNSIKMKIENIERILIICQNPISERKAVFAMVANERRLFRQSMSMTLCGLFALAVVVLTIAWQQRGTGCHEKAVLTRILRLLGVGGWEIQDEVDKNGFFTPRNAWIRNVRSSYLHSKVLNLEQYKVKSIKVKQSRS